jgi:hypothetical protein
MKKPARKPDTEPSVPTNMLSEFIAAGLAAKSFGINDLAKRVEISYEHARRAVRGESVPAKSALKEICRVLDLDYDRASRLADGAHLRSKYGMLPEELVTRPKGLEPIERVWQKLTINQKDDLVMMAQQWARRNEA